MATRLGRLAVRYVRPRATTGLDCCSKSKTDSDLSSGLFLTVVVPGPEELRSRRCEGGCSPAAARGHSRSAGPRAAFQRGFDAIFASSPHEVGLDVEFTAGAPPGSGGSPRAQISGRYSGL